MKTLTVVVIGACLFIVSQALPFPGDENETDVLKNGLPTSLIVEEGQLHGEDLTPHAREKQSKKKVVVINQYYGGPPPGYGNHGGYPGRGYGHGGYPGGYNNYPPYGYSDPYYYGSGGGGSHGGGGKMFKKLKKLG